MDEDEDVGRAPARTGLHPIVTLPRDPQAIADVLASLIRADMRAGDVVPETGLRYIPEKRDTWASPQETRTRGGGDCEDLVRVVGAHRGDAVGCVRAPQGGFHVFLFEDGVIVDPSVGRGMPAPDSSAYEGAARAPIRRRGAAFGTAPNAGEPGVSGIWATVTRVGSIVAGAAVSFVATPVAGAAVVGAGQLAAAEVEKAEAASAKNAQKHKNDATKKDTAAMHAQAQAQIASAPNADAKKAAVALAAVTSTDPNVQKKIRHRLSMPMAKDPDLAGRTRLMSMIAMLQEIGYRLPMQDTAAPTPHRAPPVAVPPPRRQPAPSADAPEDDDMWEADDLWRGWQRDVSGLGEQAACPGSCGVK